MDSVEWTNVVGTEVYNAAGELEGVSGDEEEHRASIVVRGARVRIARLARFGGPNDADPCWGLIFGGQVQMFIESDHAPLAAAEVMLGRMGLLGGGRA